MSKKWIGIILLSALFLLVGCGKESVENKKIIDDKEVISSKFTGKWKLESVSVGASDGADMKDTGLASKMSVDLDIDADGNVKELFIDDEVSIINSYKLKQKDGDEYQCDGPVISKKVYGYETESEKAYVQEVLKMLEAQDDIKITKSEQKDDEYHMDTKEQKDYVISLELDSKNLVLKKVDDKENILIQETYKKN
ncbi:hypothetical protein [Listeria innocua]|uniref:hypothetical protein n=1 Tax=Listeria innocua TaxID=1642 RepID=UPI0010E3EB97|nr:hypothetical protein [Listeria innocua]EAC7104147.1 hypothetical protein [Listeria monocytogenes]ECB9774516.1 hypothetical protein [Listeria monocytogenes]MBC2139078.1 hypothetical protein [Listeria innocua]